MMTCYIVDDEPHAAQALARYVENTPELRLLGTETNPLEAWKKISNDEIAPDVTFLDIDMPKISGITMAELLNARTEIIFTTAHPQYAIQAFDHNALDYLLKPITYERFLKAIDKTKQHLSLTIAGASAAESADHFYIKSDSKGKVVKINYDSLRYIEAKANYLSLVLDHISYLTYLTMKELEEKLPSKQFIRIHKSFIVNLKKITTVEGNQIMLENGDMLPIGGTYRSVLFSFINSRLIVSKRGDPSH